MIAKIQSCGLYGLDGFMVDAEVDIAPGLPAFDIVGLPDTAVRESRERVRAAMKNCGFPAPVKRITVNLAPADRKKEGPAYDLPIAIAILLADEQVKEFNTDEYMFLGELSLDGSLRPVNGVLPMAVCAKEHGIQYLILPKANAPEAAVVEGLTVLGADTIGQIVNHLNGAQPLEPEKCDIAGIFRQNADYGVDFADVKGQESAKRAIEVAVAGGHNIIMVGPPGSGKSMLAKRIPTILPDLTFDEAMEVTKIHSVAGVLDGGAPLLTRRPFRSPHHTVSAVGLAGGGVALRPGEISLAHHGVLFMDELPEFRRDVLEVMRQPLEDGCISISRVTGTVKYPCNVLFAASSNPCKCGYYGDPNHECTCTPPMIDRYMSKISGPLLDRIDIHIEVPAVSYGEISSTQKAEPSSAIKERVNRARQIQQERYKGTGIFSNSQLGNAQIREYCQLGEQEQALLKTAFDSLGLSARAYDRILKVARTIADLEGASKISAAHLAEAIQYRSLDRKRGGLN